MNELGIAGGILVGLVIKYFWDKWNKTYLTRDEVIKLLAEHIANCNVKDMAHDMKIIKAIVLQLAIKANIPVEEFKKLTE